MLNGVNVATSSIVCICIDEKKPEGDVIRLFHCYADEAVQFKDIGRLPIEMEELFESIYFPQSTTKSRSFVMRNNKIERNTTNKQLPEQTVRSRRGKMATFVVQVQYRQNATWQGKVLWADKNKSINFRSALELLKLIDSALEENNVSDEDENILNCLEHNSTSKLA
jgi:hypothetical protein